MNRAAERLKHFSNNAAQLLNAGREFIQLAFDADEQVKADHDREAYICNKGN
jgi:hypothetical protein